MTYLFDPAREDGLGKSAGRPDIKVESAGIAIALVLVVIVAGAVTSFMCLIAMMVGASVVGWIARHQIGGHTGDVLGMTQITLRTACRYCIYRDTSDLPDDKIMKRTVQNRAQTRVVFFDRNFSLGDEWTKH